MPTPDIWYFPTAQGDIRLERVDDKKTKLIYFKLTPSERTAMTNLRKASTGLRRRWATEDDWASIQTRDFQTGEAEERAITLNGSLKSIGAYLRGQLRPDRETVTVIRIGGGKIEEMRDQEYEAGKEPEPEPEKAKDPYREETPANEPTTALAKTGTDDGPTKAVTVKKPTRGCPAPTFAQIKLRATRVLRAFLDPQQVLDFERHQRFVTVGADTGHRYMLTSRNAPDELRHFWSRCVFDLDENRSYCVHDYEIPAEEELLTMHCLLSVRGLETWIRKIPDETVDGMGSSDIDLLLSGV